MLSEFHEPSGIGLKRVYPPPPFSSTFSAGMVAGGIQSLVHWKEFQPNAVTNVEKQGCCPFGCPANPLRRE